MAFGRICFHLQSLFYVINKDRHELVPSLESVRRSSVSHLRGNKIVDENSLEVNHLLRRRVGPPMGESDALRELRENSWMLQIRDDQRNLSHRRVTVRLELWRLEDVIEIFVFLEFLETSDVMRLGRQQLLIEN